MGFFIFLMHRTVMSVRKNEPMYGSQVKVRLKFYSYF